MTRWPGHVYLYICGIPLLPSGVRGTQLYKLGSCLLPVVQYACSHPVGSLHCHFLPGYTCLHICFISPLPHRGLGMTFHKLSVSQGLHLVFGAHLYTRTHACIVQNHHMTAQEHSFPCACHVPVSAYGIPVHMLGMSQCHHMVAYVCLFAYLQCPRATSWWCGYACIDVCLSQSDHIGV